MNHIILSCGASWEGGRILTIIQLCENFPIFLWLFQSVFDQEVIELESTNELQILNTEINIFYVTLIF